MQRILPELSEKRNGKEGDELMELPKEKYTVAKDESKKASAEMLVLGLFGMSIQQLIDDIAKNTDGKYENMYKV